MLSHFLHFRRCRDLQKLSNWQAGWRFQKAKAKQRQGRGSPKRAPATFFSVGVEERSHGGTRGRVVKTAGGAGMRLQSRLRRRVVGATCGQVLRVSHYSRWLSKKYGSCKSEVCQYDPTLDSMDSGWIPDGFHMYWNAHNLSYGLFWKALRKHFRSARRYRECSLLYRWPDLIQRTADDLWIFEQIGFSSPVPPRTDKSVAKSRNPKNQMTAEIVNVQM